MEGSKEYPCSFFIRKERFDELKTKLLDEDKKQNNDNVFKFPQRERIGEESDDEEVW